MKLIESQYTRNMIVLACLCMCLCYTTESLSIPINNLISLKSDNYGRPPSTTIDYIMYKQKRETSTTEPVNTNTRNSKSNKVNNKNQPSKCHGNPHTTCPENQGSCSMSNSRSCSSNGTSCAIPSGPTLRCNYNTSSNCGKRIGELLSQFTVVSVECKKGFANGTGTSYLSVCSGGSWLPEIKKCATNSTTNVTTTTTTTASPVVLNVTGTRTTLNTTSVSLSACGISRKVQTRIVNGQISELGEWPWMVVLGTRNNAAEFVQHCGGSLVSSRWIVSASHCRPDSMTIAILGEANLDVSVADGASPIDIQVERVVQHPNYTSPPIVNDIALIRLSTEVQFTDFIRPICILEGEQELSDLYYKNVILFVSGWGATGYGDTFSTALRHTILNFMDINSCAQRYNTREVNNVVIDERVLCAGNETADACLGDSGGPLMIAVGDTFYLAGIVSLGVGCANSEYPGVYTKVARFTDWIRETIRS